MLDPGSKARLGPYTAARFDPATAFGRFARAVCAAGCLPRKELYESWEFAKRVRRRFRSGRILEIASGHGLLAACLLYLEPGFAGARCVEPRPPPSLGRLRGTLGERWPRLVAGIEDIAGGLEDVRIGEDELVVSVHACGRLTDRIIDAALAARAPLALMPCCHKGDTGQLEGWLPAPLAIDVVRAGRLRAAGYRVHTATIPAEITPQNRILLGMPPSGGAAEVQGGE